MSKMLQAVDPLSALQRKARRWVWILWEVEQTAQSPASISGGLPFSRGSGGVQSPSEPMTGGVSGKALSAAGHLSNNLNALPRFNVGQANIETILNGKQR